jgi:hypothetical protein
LGKFSEDGNTLILAFYHLDIWKAHKTILQSAIVFYDMITSISNIKFKSNLQETIFRHIDFDDPIPENSIPANFQYFPETDSINLYKCSQQKDYIIVLTLNLVTVNSQ